MHPLQFDVDQRRQDLEDLASSGFSICRSRLIPVIGEIRSDELLQALPSRAASSSAQTLVSVEIAAREFGFDMVGLTEPLIKILSESDSLEDRCNLAIAVGRRYFSDSREAAELFSEVVLHKLCGDTRTEAGVNLVNLKLLTLMELVGVERLKRVLGEEGSELSAARAMFKGKLLDAKSYLVDQFNSGTKVILCTITSDSRLDKLGGYLLSILPDLQASGVTHIGVPDFSQGVARGYYPSHDLIRDSAELIRAINRAGLETVSTHVKDIDFNNLHQSIAETLEQRVCSLPQSARLLAFVEPDHVLRDEKVKYYAGEVTPLACRLTQIYGRSAVSTLRWVSSSETLKGNTTVGRGASRGIRTSDILKLAPGEYCIVKNSPFDPQLADLLQPHDGRGTDAVLLEG